MVSHGLLVSSPRGRAKAPGVGKRPKFVERGKIRRVTLQDGEIRLSCRLVLCLRGQSTGARQCLGEVTVGYETHETPACAGADEPRQIASSISKTRIRSAWPKHMGSCPQIRASSGAVRQIG